jgi:1-acyl-sn-glycerol-3-phosphate acyltransferase
VLKTSSGKIRRAASRELYETGQTAIAAPPPWLQVAKMWLVSLVPTARRTRRRLATVAYASYAWTMFMLLAVPTWTAIVLLPHFATRWKLMGMAARTLARLTFTAFSVEGRQRVPVDRPCVIVSNHASYLDGPVLVAALQCRFSFIAKGELLEKFIPRLFLRRIGTEFVERFDKQQSVDDAERLANLVVQNHNPLYFAEGTFQREAGLLPFRMGAFLTATRAGVPVIPVTIRGTRTILRADSWFPRHGSISVIINSPVYPPAVDVNSEQQLWNSAIKLRDEVRREILGNTGEPDLG